MWRGCLYLYVLEAALLVGGYVGYIVFMMFNERIIARLCPRPGDGDDDDGDEGRECEMRRVAIADGKVADTPTAAAEAAALALTTKNPSLIEEEAGTVEETKGGHDGAAAGAEPGVPSSSVNLSASLKTAWRTLSGLQARLVPSARRFFFFFFFFFFFSSCFAGTSLSPARRWLVFPTPASRATPRRHRAARARVCCLASDILAAGAQLSGCVRVAIVAAVGRAPRGRARRVPRARPGQQRHDRPARARSRAREGRQRGQNARHCESLKSHDEQARMRDVFECRASKVDSARSLRMAVERGASRAESAISSSLLRGCRRPRRKRGGGGRASERAAQE